MSDLALTTLGQLVADRPIRARVLEELGIDYCCGGQRTLADACAEKGIAAADAVAALECIEEVPPGISTDWRTAALDQLVSHIETTHHVFLRREMSGIAVLLDKVVTVHGRNHPELHQLSAKYTAFQDEMYAHLSTEDYDLFPMIRRIVDGSPEESQRGAISSSIRVLLTEHDAAGAALATMRDLTHGFRAPSDGCGSFVALLDRLAGLERDTHEHIHKENNILFPRAIEAEAANGVN
jgi:regulator of cell morphogenesis and NO signaling